MSDQYEYDILALNYLYKAKIANVKFKQNKSNRINIQFKPKNQFCIDGMFNVNDTWCMLYVMETRFGVHAVLI